MKWINDPDVAAPSSLLCLDPKEVEQLKKLLDKPRKEYTNRIDRYNDILMSGEASTRQQNALIKAENVMEFLDKFYMITK